MSYVGRGGFSSLNVENSDIRNESNNNNNTENIGRYYSGGFFRIYYYIPLDNTYVVFQIIMTLIIFLTAAATFLITYKTTIIDPIYNIKRVITNSYIVISLISIILVLLVNYFSKNKKSLIKRLTVLLISSILVMFIFYGIKAYIKSTYTEEKFAQIYTQEYGEEENSKVNFKVNLKGVELQTEKEHYVTECIQAYKVFSIRMTLILIINLLIIILLIYQIYKVLQIQDGQDRLSKDDAILFDEEQNIRY